MVKHPRRREKSKPDSHRAPAKTATGLLFHGRHPIEAALRNPARAVHKIWATPSAAETLRQICRDCGRPLPDIISADRRRIDEILNPEAVHQGMIAQLDPLPALSIEDIIHAQSDNQNAVIVLLDQVTDPHNVGAILRSAAAFKAAAVVVPDRNAPPETGTLAKSASGALEVIAYVHGGNLARGLASLKQAGYWITGLDGGARQTLAQAGLTGKIALVLGSEATGLRRLTREACDHIVKLPISGKVQSLNVSNAAAIALYELARAQN